MEHRSTDAREANGLCLNVYYAYCGTASEQRAARCIAAPGRPIRASHHRCRALRNTRRRSATKAGEQNRLGPVERTCKDCLVVALFLGGYRLSGATPWALFASLARYRRKKIMVLLKRNLEGSRVHSCIAACTANLQELYLSQSGGSSAVLIRRRRCRNSTYANWYWQWKGPPYSDPNTDLLWPWNSLTACFMPLA
jgi:hypothetical protein